MTEADLLADAQADAVDSLVGHNGIIGVGRDDHSLVFFVEDWQRAEPLIRHWSKSCDIKGSHIEYTHLTASPATPAADAG